MCRLFLAVLVALFSTTFTVHAWTASSAASSFGGKSLVTGANIKSHSSSIVVLQNGSTTVMKKGKANVQPEMRGQYKRQKEMAEMQSQMMAASKPGEDGLPVFNLFVRTKTQKVRYIRIYACVI